MIADEIRRDKGPCVRGGGCFLDISIKSLNFHFVVHGDVKQKVIWILYPSFAMRRDFPV